MPYASKGKANIGKELKRKQVNVKRNSSPEKMMQQHCVIQTSTSLLTH
jgi:hypothetical protein